MKHAFPMRQAGKSRLLAALYGTQAQNLPRDLYGHVVTKTHPLEYASGFTFEGFEPRLGHVAVYKVATKIISEIMHKEKVPHTDVFYRMLNEFHPDTHNKTAAIAWIRRTKMQELEAAVATLLMLGKEVVVLRAFEPCISNRG